MLTKNRRANILSISVGLLARSYTVPIVEKFVERAKAVRESTPGYRPYRTAETTVPYLPPFVILAKNDKVANFEDFAKILALFPTNLARTT